MELIDLKKQYRLYQAEIDQRIHAVLEHGRFIMGSEIEELELALAAFTGAKHCITVASGTTSLEIALRVLGIGQGDEVITVPFTWISTAEAIRLTGAKAVFVDICESDFNIDINQIENAITPTTKAIMPVSLFGQTPDYDKINAIAANHGLQVIEDAAQSFGATRHGSKSCNLTRIASTSFFPAKPFGCYGDGGALFTSDDELALKMRAIRTHGGIQRHVHPYLGTNGRFDTIQAAVLLAKLPYFPDEVTARSAIGARYSELLSDVCMTPPVMPENTHVYAQYTIRVADRDALASSLKTEGIPTAVYYPKCLHEQPVFSDCGYSYGDFPVSESASREVISLPMHPYLSIEDQDKITQAVKKHI